MSRCKTTVAVLGDTFPVRNRLKALGGTWDPKAGTWYVPTENYELARLAVNNPHIYGDDAAVNERTERT